MTTLNHTRPDEWSEKAWYHACDTVGERPLTAPFVGGEGGGGATKTGCAWLWTTPDGTPPRAIRVYTRGHLSNGHHADVVLSPGSYHVYVAESRADGLYVGVARLGTDGVLTLVALQERGRWLVDDDLPDAVCRALSEAIRVCVRKARTYHCREAMYVA